MASAGLQRSRKGRARANKGAARRVQAPPLPSGLELSELDDEFREAPHPRLDRLRASAARYLDPTSEGGRLFLTTHADVRAALFDRALSRDKNVAPTREEGADASLLSMEGERHLMGRKLIGRAFDARAAEARRGDIVAIVDGLLDKIEAAGGCDAIADFAGPIPLIAIADILGLVVDDAAEMRGWCEDVGVLTMLPARTADQNRRLFEAALHLHGAIRRAIALKRVTPCADLISDLIAAETHGQRLSDDEIAPLCLLVLAAGNLTTTDVIGNAIMLFVQNPDQLALLQARPELIDSAIEEVLRFDPPVSAVARHPVREGEHFGCPLRAGATVKISLIAANRDPALFDDPHAFRIDRTTKGHVSFGGGSHACPGAALARLEAKIAIGRFFARFPAARLAGCEAPARKTTYGFRGYGRLELRV